MYNHGRCLQLMLTSEMKVNRLSIDHFQGCLLGGAIGDAVGAIRISFARSDPDRVWVIRHRRICRNE
jgi:hypothetical protein